MSEGNSRVYVVGDNAFGSKMGNIGGGVKKVVDCHSHQSGDFKVSTDVSFPIAVQESDSLADQIAKLNRLREDGIISQEEMAVAKAKLLS